MSFASALRCRECSREYPLDPIYVCEFCFGPLEVVYDYDSMRESVSRERIEAGPRSIWRYADLLPCDADAAVVVAIFGEIVHQFHVAVAAGRSGQPVQTDRRTM